MTEIIVAFITGGLAFLGVLVSNRAASNKMMQNMNTSQAVMDERLGELTREVREHNNFAQRLPVVEEQIKVMNHRISDLEGFHKPKE